MFIVNYYNLLKLTINDKIYLIGGYTDTFQVFDPSAHTWSTPVTFGTYSRREFATAGVVNDKIYLIGGQLWTTTGNALEEYDPSTKVWSVPKTTGKFITTTGPCSSVLNGKIYVFGGDSSNQYINSHPTNLLQIFDPASNSWTIPSTSGTFTPRSFLTSSVIDGKIYVLGGEKGIDSDLTKLNTLEVFDPLTNTWSTPITTGNFTPRSMLTSSVVGGKIC